MLVTSWKNGDKWYRKYSDGFIEQGGSVAVRSSSSSWQTVTLNIAFSNTNYTLIAVATHASDNTHITDVATMVKSKTKTNFQIADWGNRGNSWYACGF